MPGVGSQLAGMTDTLSGLAQDAFSIFETALRPPQRPASRPSAQAPRPAAAVPEAVPRRTALR